MMNIDVEIRHLQDVNINYENRHPTSSDHNRHELYCEVGLRKSVTYFYSYSW